MGFVDIQKFKDTLPAAIDPSRDGTHIALAQTSVVVIGEEVGGDGADGAVWVPLFASVARSVSISLLVRSFSLIS